MATVEKISIALPPEMVRELCSAVESGEYSSTSEVIREALRAWKLRKKVEQIEMEELRRIVKEGIESGESVEAGSVLLRLRQKYSSMIESDKNP